MKPTDIARRAIVRAIAGIGVLASARGLAAAQGAEIAAPGKVLVDNDRVRVYGVVAKPGQSVIGAPAAGRPPRLAVFMSDAKVKMAQAGAAPKVTAYKTGDIVWDAGDVSLAESAGTKEVSVYLVEPKGKPVGGAAHANWKPTAVQVGGKILYENDYVRLIEHAARPRMGVCGEAMHTHLDHLTIVLTDSRVRIVTPDKEPVIKEPPAGAVFWDPSGPHSITNVGSRNSRALLVEIKTA